MHFFTILRKDANNPTSSGYRRFGSVGVFIWWVWKQRIGLLLAVARCALHNTNMAIVIVPHVAALRFRDPHDLHLQRP